MTEDELKAIEERANAATAGVWRRAYPVFSCTMDHGQGRSGHGQGKCEYRFQGWKPDSTDIYSDPGYKLDQIQPDNADRYIVAGMWDYETGGIQHEPDAEFIAHAREDIPALIAEIRRLRASSVTWQEPTTR